MKRFFAFVCLSAALALLLSGCHDEVNPPDNTPPRGPSAAVPHTAPTAAPTEVVVYVLNPKASGEESVLMPREITVQHPEEPAKDAVTALLEAGRSPLAPGVSLRGISVNNGIATLDFSQSPIKPGGEGQQSAGLNALAMTLGQFPEISSYRVKVQGSEIKSFGEFTTDGPMDVIRPGTAADAKGGGQ